MRAVGSHPDDWLDPSLIDALRESGNQAWAEALAQRDPDRARGRTAFRLASRPGAVVTAPLLAPLVVDGHIDAPRVLWVPLSLGAQPSPALHEDAEAASQRALDEAWARVGGSGSRPTRYLGSPLLERLVRVGVVPRVRGSSFALAAFLIGATEFGSSRGATVFTVRAATGCPSSSLGEATAKLEAIRDLRARAPGARMMLAGAEAIGDDLVGVPTFEEAWRRGFWVPPHLSPRHLHIALAGRHNAEADETISGPAYVGPEEAHRIADEAIQKIRSAQVPWKLTIGGPVGLWALLGARLRNGIPRDRVVIFSSDDGHLQVSNMVKHLSESVPPPEPVGSPTFFLTTGDQEGPVGAVRIRLPPEVRGEDVPGILKLVLGHAHAAPRGRVSFALRGPGPIAAAVALALSGHHTLDFLHYDRESRAYAPWPLLNP